MNRLLRRTLYGLVLAVALYLGAVIFVDADRIASALDDYAWSGFVIALGLSAVNYLLRFAKWELSLGWLNVRAQAPNLGRGRSLLIYLAGLSMSISPGKLGEVLRSVLLRASDGVPFSRTAPIVLADRLTDVLALVILTLVGISRYDALLPVVYVAIALVLGVICILGSPRLLNALLRRMGRWPRLHAAATRLEPLVASSATLLRPRPLLLLTLISVVGWWLECLGYFLILDAFPGVEADLEVCTFLWAATTLVGAVSFLPGGLGATEGSLVLLVTRLVSGVSQPVALASTLLIRGATLWYGEAIGAVALVLFLRDKTVRARAHEVSIEDSSP